MLVVLVVVVVAIVVLFATLPVASVYAGSAAPLSVGPDSASSASVAPSVLTTARDSRRSLSSDAAFGKVAAARPGIRVYAPRKALVLTMRRIEATDSVDPRVARLALAEYLSEGRVVRTPDAMAGVAITRGGDVAAYLAKEKTCVVWHEGTLLVVAALHLVRNGRLLVVTPEGLVAEQEEADDNGACRWAIARGGWGGPCCVSRSALEFENGEKYVYELAPKEDLAMVVQPNHEVSERLGIEWKKEGCTSSNQTGGRACENACSVCDAWSEFKLPLSCSAVALNGWCSVHADVRDRCELSCGLYLGTEQTTGARIAALNKTDDSVVFAKTPPRVTMYLIDERPEGASRIPTMSDLTATVRSKRWQSGGVMQDPSVSTENPTVDAWEERDRDHFWRVLRAMDTGRLSDDQHFGVCVHMNVTDDGSTAVPFQWREDEDAVDSRSCERACVRTAKGRRNLSLFGILGLCPKFTDEQWLGMIASTGHVRTNNAAHKIMEYFGPSTRDIQLAFSGVKSEADIAIMVKGLVNRKVLDVKQGKRLHALLARDYTELTWSEVRDMFQLRDDEMNVLQAAVVGPVHAKVTPKNEWTLLSPKQRLVLVGEWHGRVRVSFHVPSATSVSGRSTHSSGSAVGSGTQILQMPGHATGRFAKFYTLWPTDRLTGVGANVNDGQPRACVRCRAELRRPRPVHARRQCANSELDASNKDVDFVVDGTRYILHNTSLENGYTEKRDCFQAVAGRRNERIWTPMKEYGVPIGDSSYYNDCVASVDIPPGFACYVTPHYHSYHMSARTCMQGLAHLNGVPVLNGHRLQCMMSHWSPQYATFAQQQRAEPMGIVLINDNLATRWVVRAGDVLATHAMTGVQDEKGRLRFPYVVNCIAAWNYYAEPTVWLQRAHDDPNAGDSMPLFDAVSKNNNVRRTSDSISAFIEYHKSESVNVRTIMRSNDAEKILAKAKQPEQKTIS